MTELLNTPVWLAWCGVVAAAFMVGVGVGWLLREAREVETGKEGFGI